MLSFGKNKVGSYILRRRLLLKYGIHIYPEVKIGKNLSLPHPISIVIGGNTIIGDNCTIYHNVTLGQSHKKYKRYDYPVIGNNVTIYTNTLIMGNVKIGDNVIIGAHSVVDKDLKSNGIYAGNPAKLVRKL